MRSTADYTFSKFEHQVAFSSKLRLSAICPLIFDWSTSDEDQNGTDVLQSPRLQLLPHQVELFPFSVMFSFNFAWSAWNNTKLIPESYALLMMSFCVLCCNRIISNSLNCSLSDPWCCPGPTTTWHTISVFATQVGVQMKKNWFVQGGFLVTLHGVFCKFIKHWGFSGVRVCQVSWLVRI